MQGWHTSKINKKSVQNNYKVLTASLLLKSVMQI